MKILPAQKKHALSRGKLRCVGEIATLNVSRGCAGACAFCFARCYSGAPPPGAVALYHELPGLLRRELDSRHRKRPLPRWVLFATACDGFLGGPEVLQVTRQCLEILLRRQVGVSLSTRGEIPDDIVAMLARHAEHVRVFVPLVSLSRDYHAAWEPGAASARRRLFLIQRLREAGLRPRVRLDPLIPFVNDDTENLRQLFSALNGLGVRQVIASYLHLRPGVGPQIQAEAPVQARPLVLGGFPELEDQPERFHHLPLNMRQASVRRLERIARERGLSVSICYCNNPGLTTARCPVVPPQLPEPDQDRQGSLFE